MIDTLKYMIHVANVKMDTTINYNKWIYVIVILISCFKLQSGQSPNDRQQCTYTFNVPVSEFEAQCVTSEIRQTLDEIRRENKKILSENVELKEQVENLFKEYGDIIQTVKNLKADTQSWRQTVEWPVYDVPFDNGQPNAIIDKGETHNDCYQALRRKEPKKQGIYPLKPRDAQQTVFAYCDADGWTVFLRHINETSEFDRSWSDYSGGFGNLAGDHWLGLETLHLMTSSKDYQLRMESIGYNNKMYYGEWDNFKVGDELDKYRLSVENMTDGNYHDVMQKLDGTEFSTKDSDNDDWYANNCANYYKGAWWLQDCGFDPNRPWCRGNGCMTWGDVNIKKILLKIRPMIAKGVNLSKAKPIKEKPARTKPPRIRNAPKKPKKPKNKKKNPKYKIRQPQGFE